MGATSLFAPQTLNLYTYCGNDPINHTDANGLFFGSLFKWIGKIFKVILIAVAVFVAVIAIAAASWGFAAPVVAKLAFLSGSLFAQALAPPKIGAIIGIVTGLILSGPGIIVNLTSTAGKISLWQKLLSASNFVGAISNFFQTKGKKSKKTSQSSGTKKGNEAKDACPAQKRRFFDNLDLYKDMARQLNTDTNFLLAHSSLESGWLDNHNFALHNLFGTTKGGGRNLSYSSFQASADDYIRRYGQYLNGAQSIDDFASGLKNVPPNGYNVVTQGYYDKVINQLQSVKKWEGICAVSP